MCESALCVSGVFASVPECVLPSTPCLNGISCDKGKAQGPFPSFYRQVGGLAVLPSPFRSSSQCSLSSLTLPSSSRMHEFFQHLLSNTGSTTLRTAGIHPFNPNPELLHPHEPNLRKLFKPRPEVVLHPVGLMCVYLVRWVCNLTFRKVEKP